MVQEGLFVIENISFYADAKLGTEMTAEADWKRRGLYIGPQVRFKFFVTPFTILMAVHTVRDFGRRRSGRVHSLPSGAWHQR